MQLGHAGAKGSTRVPWEGEDLPLDERQLAADLGLAAAVPRRRQRLVARDDARRHGPRRATTSCARRATPPRPASTGSSCTARTATCCRRSSRRSPTSAPTSTAARSRTACAIRSRSSTRCARSGRSTCRSRCASRRTTGSRAASRPTTRSRSRARFKAAGVDLIDCSSGQVSKRQQPVYGRMYQTPFADRIRNEAGIPTIAVGAISEADHVNSIIAAGRADLCAIARPHLANPAWTLLESAQASATPRSTWPKQYRSAKHAARAQPRARAADGARRAAACRRSSRRTSALGRLTA